MKFLETISFTSTQIQHSGMHWGWHQVLASGDQLDINAISLEQLGGPRSKREGIDRTSFLKSHEKSHSNHYSHQQEHLCGIWRQKCLSTPLTGRAACFPVPHSGQLPVGKVIFASLTHIKWMWILGLCLPGIYPSFMVTSMTLTQKSCSLETSNFSMFSASPSESARWY